VRCYRVSTSFLAALPGNGSYSSSEPSSSPYHLAITMNSSPTLAQFSAPKGEKLEPPSSSHPIHTSGYELCPGFIAMARDQSFAGTDEENPYTHLREFEQLCSCITIEGMAQDTLKWILFPFSLTGRAKQ
jgi:hypothetical protein